MNRENEANQNVYKIFISLVIGLSFRVLLLGLNYMCPSKLQVQPLHRLQSVVIAQPSRADRSYVRSGSNPITKEHILVLLMPLLTEGEIKVGIHGVRVNFP
jgi:hypothetical protein